MTIKRKTIEEDLFGLSGRRTICNSKVKGNTNERNACKPLAVWTGEKFTRTPQSGAIRRINVEGVVADIIPDTLNKNFYWPFSVETKHLKSISHQRMLRTSSHIFSIWEQVWTDALRSHKLPMALLRSNNMPKGEYYMVLDAGLGGSIMALNTPILFSGSNHKFSLIGFLMSDVILYTPYERFAGVIKNRNFVANSKVYTDV